MIFEVRSPIRDAERVACPTCGERPPWKCRALRSGRTTDTHKARYDAFYATPEAERWQWPDESTI